MLNQLFSMNGKVCVVTGGSRGLGYFIAKGFLAAGAKRVYITARKTQDCIDAAKQLSELDGAQGECIALPGNLSSMQDIGTLVAELNSRESSLDVLVNNAGTGWLEPLESFSEKGWNRVMDLNVKAPFFLTRELVPLLAQDKAIKNTASVINIGSSSGICAQTDTFSYSPSKAAIHQVTRNLAVELCDKHIRVNAIAPGRFITKMTAYVEKDQYEKEIALMPLNRWGEESDINGVAIMLASSAGEFITGQILPVDGGTTLVK